ncbi:MAG: UPF0158 family protein [Panacibacter sp.]
MKEKIILTQVIIKDIAGNLECGNNCWYHIPTGKVLWAPTRDEAFDLDKEIWRETFEEIDSKMHECIAFECLDTHESFRILESFAENEVDDKVLRTKLITALANKKPFRHFKLIVDNSNYREAWFAFKNQWYIEYVEEELERYNSKNEEVEEDDE